VPCLLRSLFAFFPFGSRVEKTSLDCFKIGDYWRPDVVRSIGRSVTPYCNLTVCFFPTTAFAPPLQPPEAGLGSSAVDCRVPLSLRVGPGVHQAHSSATAVDCRGSQSPKLPTMVATRSSSDARRVSPLAGERRPGWGKARGRGGPTPTACALLPELLAARHGRRRSSFGS